MAASPRQIFEYLLAVQNLARPPIRDFRQFEKSFYVDELPRGEGCYLFGEGETTDAWLEIHKQNDIPPAPEPDPLFKEWLTTDHRQSNTPPQVKKKREILPSLHFSKDAPPYREEKFEDQPARVEAFRQWLERWETWAEEHRHKTQVQNLYNLLFALVNRMEREGETLELAFGHGLLLWDLPSGRILHPLLTTRMELHFDARKGRFTLTPTRKGTILETEMLTGVKLPQETHLPRLRKQVEQTGHPLNREEAIPLYKEMAQTLHPEGRFIEGESRVKVKKNPVVLEKPVFFLRKRTSQLWKDELRTAIEALGEGMKVPKTIQSLLRMERIEPSQEERKAWDGVRKDLFFPLPANEEQKEIARRLAQNHGVTVQGPPGTGKSHTIANLISHLLAHGKKVLVTSHKEPALRVLAEKIPEEIRSLCVSVLGRDSRSLNEIEQSIGAISSEMAVQDPELLKREVEQLKQELKSTRQNIEECKLQLKQMAARNMEAIQWGEESLSPMKAAQKLTETEAELSWIPDRIDTAPPLTDSDMRKMWALAGELPLETRSLLKQSFPTPDSLPNAAAYRSLLAEGEKTEEAFNQSRHLLRRYRLPDSNPKRRELLRLLQPILKEGEGIRPPFAQKILSDLLAGGKRKEMWTQLIGSVEQTLEEITAIQNRLAEYDIQLPKVPRHQLQQDIQTLIDRLREGKSIRGLYLMLSGRKLRYLVEHPAVDHRSVQTVEEAELIAEQLKMEEKRYRLVKRWNTLMTEVDGPALDAAQNRLVALTEDLLHHLRKIVRIQALILKLKAESDSVTLPEDFSWSSLSSFEELEAALQAVEMKLKHKEWEVKYERQTHHLFQEAAQSKAHPICQRLADAWRQKDARFWEATFEELIQLHECREKNRQLQGLATSLRKAAPNWTDRIISRMGTPTPFPDRWQEAWEWRRVHTEVEKINGLEPEKLELKLEEEQQRERRLLGSIVAKSAWRAQLLRITEPQKRALIAWKQKIKKIGKGTGKYAAKHRQEARVEMERCQPAIPVWIMPVDRVIENLDLRNDRFDVVIVDESSQCDLFALAALLRAERAVIVGDDEQISPAAVGTDQEAVRSLIQRHLQGVPQASNLDMQTSLYDVATRIFPGTLRLKEHFRCVPEIIQFSNDLSYGGEIIPLRKTGWNPRSWPAGSRAAGMNCKRSMKWKRRRSWPTFKPW
ncbi:AAA domain-containing protein [Melghirimyces profundicolus]|uniref:AAA domain-containing protein n=1 Tax=Melghirimyces profundicolus TaxID=1242148 RepID=A0A2T6B9G1_9BACL|nr:AAA domain-containing protein [Melghirimyces profundicolus]PTX52693.1 AAA domain-containing protein [Melghirimyces profundicolus]